MLYFRECPDKGYRPRTEENASADCTIAFAVDFYTGGEILTKNSALKQGKLYIPIPYPLNGISTEVAFAVNQFNLHNVKTINIAGNGIYTIMKVREIQPTPDEVIKYQNEIDEFVFTFLDKVINHKDLVNKIEVIRTGGQTGFDEAGAKAGVRLNIDTLIYAPLGWRLRGMDGDIADEIKFKERFQ